MVAIKRDYPGDRARERHISFIMANWNMLARESYRQFLANGRGLLVVQEADFIGKPRGVLTRIQMAYIAESNPECSLVLGEKELGWLKDYDPATTLLVGVLREDEGLSSYRLGAVSVEKTPRAIHDGQ